MALNNEQKKEEKKHVNGHKSRSKMIAMHGKRKETNEDYMRTLE